MNNKTKGWIAAGLGGALLLGTGGTFALWSDSATLESAATVGAGQLELAKGDSFEWYEVVKDESFEEDDRRPLAVGGEVVLVPLHGLEGEGSVNAILSGDLMDARWEVEGTIDGEDFSTLIESGATAYVGDGGWLAVTVTADTDLGDLAASGEVTFTIGLEIATDFQMGNTGVDDDNWAGIEDRTVDVSALNVTLQQQPPEFPAAP